MGLFLAGSGIVGRDSTAVESSLANFASTNAGAFEKRVGTTDDPNIGVMAAGGQNTTILYPRDFMFWDDLSQHLSKELQAPVFSFHIHDGDLWMFVLFDKGEWVDAFNPLPDYWEELDPAERTRWTGDALAVCRCVPGLNPASIKNYFVEWTPELEDSRTKAYPDDEFPYGSDWQLTDFMRRVGLRYPLRDDGNPDGPTFYLRVRRRRDRA